MSEISLTLYNIHTNHTTPPNCPLPTHSTHPSPLPPPTLPTQIIFPPPPRPTVTLHPPHILLTHCTSLTSSPYLTHLLTSPHSPHSPYLTHLLTSPHSSTHLTHPLTSPPHSLHLTHLTSNYLIHLCTGSVPALPPCLHLAFIHLGISVIFSFFISCVVVFRAFIA